MDRAPRVARGVRNRRLLRQALMRACLVVVHEVFLEHPLHLAFAGHNPAHDQSGTSVRKKTRISHTGSAALRAALSMPAAVAKRYNPIVRPFAQRLLDRGLCPMAVIAAIMRKLLHLIYGILKSGRPFDPNFRAAS